MRLNKTFNRNLQLFLAGICLICISSMWQDLTRDHSLPIVLSSVPSDSEYENILNIKQPPALPEITGFASIKERPLFNEDRRPEILDIIGEEEQPPEETISDQNMDISNLLLSGIVLTNDKALTLLQTINDNKIHRLGMGESINGWAITNIQKKTVLLTRENEMKTLELLVKKSSTPTTVAQRRQLTPTTKEETKEAGSVTPAESIAENKPMSRRAKFLLQAQAEN